MQKFIFGERSGIYIIDLEKTVQCLKEAQAFLTQVASEGKGVLFVGTKRQAQEAVASEAARCGAYFVNQRWLGGLLTNFVTIRKSVKRLKELEKMQQDGIFESLSKKEVSMLKREMENLRRNLSGVVEMQRLPGAVFVIDSKKEEIAVREANRLSIPVVALIDTNSDPDLVQYPIPGNDDAIKSIKLIITMAADAVLEGRQRFSGKEAAATEEVVQEAAEPKLSELEELLEKKLPKDKEPKATRTKMKQTKREKKKE
jgi:small subunit ribosomal protein S2